MWKWEKVQKLLWKKSIRFVKPLNQGLFIITFTRLFFTYVITYVVRAYIKRM